MTNNYTPVFTTTCRLLIPKKYFNDKRYFIETVVYDEEYDPELAGLKEYIVYKI